MTNDDLEVFAEFVEYLKNRGLTDLLLKVGDPNVAAGKWKNSELFVRNDGALVWTENGRPHRIGAPAIIRPDGGQEWRQNGKLHRDDGPAHIDAANRQEWYRNGKLHRDDGPAQVWPGGIRVWWKNGKIAKQS